MKLLFLFNSRVAKRGSFEDLMVALAREAARRGDRCAFVFPGLGVPDFELQQLADVHVIPGPWTGLGAVHAIGRIVARFGPDVMNAHFCDTLVFLPLYAWARLRGIRVVCHYHGEILPLEQVQPIKRVFNSLRLITWPATRVVTVSRANQRYLHHLRVRPEVEVIYNGIDVDRFQAGGPPETRSPAVPPGRYILYLGSLIPRKRVDFLLHAFHRVAARIPDVKLVVAGGGAVEEHRAIAFRLGLADRVIFTGLLRDYPMALVRNARMLVSASMQESFGLVFVEAMALGVPVVACRVGGIPEVVMHGEVGLLAEPDDLEGFADHLARLLDDEELRRRLAARGPSWARERFALDAHVPAILESLQGAPRSAAPAG